MLWGEIDYLVDPPPGTGDALTVMQSLPLDGLRS